MTPIQKALLAQRFDFACGYCGTTETEVGATLTVDHFHPTSQGGADSEENWIYACSACNTFKSDYWPLNAEDFALLRPSQDDFAVNWREIETGFLEPLTERGRFHIEKLHLNRSQLVAKRLERQALEREIQQTRALRVERDELEKRVAELMREMFGA